MFNKKVIEKNYIRNLTQMAKAIGASLTDEEKDIVLANKRIQNLTLADELDKTNKKLNAILTHLNLEYFEVETKESGVRSILGQSLVVDKGFTTNLCGED